MFYLLVPEIIYTLLLLCKLARRIQSHPDLGKFCFYAKPGKRDLFPRSIAFLLYMILIIIVLAIPNSFHEESSIKVVLVLIPAFWLLYLFVPVSVYEHGFKYFDGCVTEDKIRHIENYAQSTYKIYIINKQSISGSVEEITIRIPAVKSIPDFFTKATKE